MKFVRAAIAGGFLAFVMTVSAQAQNLSASIPFKFTAGGQVMPAGDYAVKVDRAYQRLEITNLAARVMAYVPLMAPTQYNSKGEPVLVFNTYGTAHFLATVQGGGYVDGWSLFPSRGEREAADKLAKSTTEIALAR